MKYPVSADLPTANLATDTAGSSSRGRGRSKPSGNCGWNRSRGHYNNDFQQSGLSECVTNQATRQYTAITCMNIILSVTFHLRRQ